MALRWVQNVDFVFLSSLRLSHCAAWSPCCLVGCLIWVGTVQLKVIRGFVKVGWGCGSILVQLWQIPGGKTIYA